MTFLFIKIITSVLLIRSLYCRVNREMYIDCVYAILNWPYSRRLAMIQLFTFGRGKFTDILFCFNATFELMVKVTCRYSVGRKLENPSPQRRRFVCLG